MGPIAYHSKGIQPKSAKTTSTWPCSTSRSFTASRMVSAILYFTTSPLSAKPYTLVDKPARSATTSRPTPSTILRIQSSLVPLQEGILLTAELLFRENFPFSSVDTTLVRG